MKTVREVIRRPPIWVNPEHTVETAVVLMRGHEIGGLPVLDSSKLVGFLSYQQLLGVNLHTQVGEVMLREFVTVAPGISVKEAGDIMAGSGVTRAPVIENDRLIGVVTHGDLLPEIGRSFDPLTLLPWSDSLREWAISHLKRGVEITVLFLDLDRFGQFNKRYGHIIGDGVLRTVGQAMAELVDPDLDYLCRYGGDEFCIGTLKLAEDATEFANRVGRRLESLSVPGTANERISCSIGQFGGKRSKEREHTHYAATLNNLINLASRDCIANKQPQGTIIEQEGESQKCGRDARLRLGWIEVEWDGPVARVRVELFYRPWEDGGAESGDRHLTASLSAETDEEGVLNVVAQAAVCCVESALPDGYGFVLTDLFVRDTPSEARLVTAAGEFTTPSQIIPVVGSSIVTRDPYRAAACAVLSAVNRLVGNLPPGELASKPQD